MATTTNVQGLNQVYLNFFLETNGSQSILVSSEELRVQSRYFILDMLVALNHIDRSLPLSGPDIIISHLVYPRAIEQLSLWVEGSKIRC